MQKKWNNPELKSLLLESTSEGYGGAYVKGDSEQYNIEEAISLQNTKCLIIPVQWKYYCPCDGWSTESYRYPWEAANAFILHWNSFHKNGCSVSAS